MTNSLNNLEVASRKRSLPSILLFVLLLGIGLSLQGCYGASEETPAEGAPAEGAPAEGAPAEGAPAEGASTEDQPNQSPGESGLAQRKDEKLIGHGKSPEHVADKSHHANAQMTAHINSKAAVSSRISPHSHLQAASLGESLMRRVEAAGLQNPDYLDQQTLQENRDLLKQVKQFVESEKSLAAEQISSKANKLAIEHLATRQASIEEDMKKMVEELAINLEPGAPHIDPTEPPAKKAQITRAPPAPAPPAPAEGRTEAEEAEYQELERRVKLLEASKLPFSVNRPKHEIDLQNFNLHISSVAHEHGVGNLIVGEENDVQGASNSIVQGFHNAAAGEGVAVIGGYDNVAEGDLTTITGGHLNMATGLASSVTGGIENQATALGSSVAGGIDNIAGGRGSVAAGGEQNDATGVASVVVGGGLNMATNKQTGTFAGYKNQAVGPNAATYLGYANIANGNGVGIFGGENVEETQHGKILIGRVGPPKPAEEPDCDKCANDFQMRGGCKALQEGNTVEVLRLRPTDDIECAPCAAYVEHSCTGTKLPDFSQHTSKDHCDSCVAEFSNKGGCTAYQIGDWPKVQSVVETLDPTCEDCAAYAEDHCAALGSPEEILTGAESGKEKTGPAISDDEMSLCPTCAEDFVQKGGCDAWRDQNWEELHLMAPRYGSACFKCEKHVADHCQIPMELRGDMGVSGRVKAKGECGPCVHTFMEEGGCDAWKHANWIKLDEIAPKSTDDCYGCEQWAADACQIPVELRGTPAAPPGEVYNLDVHQFSSGATCGKCMADFQNLGGCMAWKQGAWDHINNDIVPALGSTCGSCVGEAEKWCNAPASGGGGGGGGGIGKDADKDCQQCGQIFEYNGGCAAEKMQNWNQLDSIKAKLNADHPQCKACDGYMAEHCSGRSSGTCMSCVDFFNKNHGCDLIAKNKAAQFDGIVRNFQNNACGHCQAGYIQSCQATQTAGSQQPTQIAPPAPHGQQIPIHTTGAQKDAFKAQIPTINEQTGQGASNGLHTGATAINKAGETGMFIKASPHSASSVAESLPLHRIHLANGQNHRFKDNAKDPSSLSEDTSNVYRGWGVRPWGRY